MARFRSALVPTQEFRARTRATFLRAFGAEIPHGAMAGRWGYFLRGLATGMALMVMVSGAAVYADQTNVGPESVLYPLKRSQEIVNLTLAGETEKPLLHLKFAERRLSEIESVRERDSDDGALPSLREDLRREVRQSLTAISNGTHAVTIAAPVPAASSAGALLAAPISEDHVASSMMPLSAREARSREHASVEKIEKAETGRRNRAVCQSFKSLLENGASDVREIVREHKSFLSRFEERCVPLVGEPEIVDDDHDDLQEKGRGRK